MQKPKYTPQMDNRILYYLCVNLNKKKAQIIDKEDSVHFFENKTSPQI